MLEVELPDPDSASTVGNRRDTQLFVTVSELRSHGTAEISDIRYLLEATKLRAHEEEGQQKVAGLVPSA